jgi:hypothetical protein
MAENNSYLKYLLHNSKPVPAKNENATVPTNQSYKYYSVCCGFHIDKYLDAFSSKLHKHLSENIMLEYSWRILIGYIWNDMKFYASVI